MSDNRLKVGIIGMQPERSWGWQAHLPALRAQPDTYDIVGVANSNKESSQKAATAAEIPKAYANADELIADPQIDIVAVTVKVEHHVEIVQSAIRAGKHVYCEWPLGMNLEEAKLLAAAAKEKGILGVIGLQAMATPVVMYLRQLINDGYVGKVLSSTVTGWDDFFGGPTIGKAFDYTVDAAKGAGHFEVAAGHTLLALRSVLGELSEVSALLATRRDKVTVRETGEILRATAADQVLINALFASGAPLSLHYHVGRPPQGWPCMVWDITGIEGDLRVTGSAANVQLAKLSLEGRHGEERVSRPLEVPAAYDEGLPQEPMSGNVARIYARLAADLRDGTHTAPWFEDAVQHHRLLATIKDAAGDGRRHGIDPPLIPLPGS